LIPEFFETSDLNLRPVAEEDADFILELMNTPGWLQFIGDRNVKTTSDARQYIVSRMVPQFLSCGFGNYVIIRKSDAVKMGTCGLYDREGLDGVDLGFAMLPEYMGKGYAYESATELINKAKSDFGLKRLVAITTRDNQPSGNLLKKLGFHHSGWIVLPGFPEEMMLFTLNLQI
jgi:ribosomal-protein-alanine N-acetyltransferase